MAEIVEILAENVKPETREAKIQKVCWRLQPHAASPMRELSSGVLIMKHKYIPTARSCCV